MLATLNNFVSGIFLRKQREKTFQKEKQFYFPFISQIFSIQNHFRFKKILFSFRKHFHFCLPFKVFSFQKQKQFYFRFENTFISLMFSKQKHFRFKKNYFRFENTFTFVSKTLLNINRKKSHKFCGRVPCVPTPVEGQCFHLRRLDLQILLCRCLAPVARDRIARTCRLVWVFPCCDNLSLGKCLWGICDIRRITCGLE